jgi:preprotein translocase subunit SecA
MQSTRVFTTASAKWTAVVETVRRIHKSGRPILIGTRNVHDSEYVGQLLTDEGLDHQILNARLQKQEAQIIAGAGRKGCITVATNMAGRGTDIRLGAGVAELGGLHVIATEIHEARRIDRQLYGRCARQGDPGSAQAFVSLEDELMQQYATLTLKMLRRCLGGNGREISSSLSRRLVHSTQQHAEKAAYRQRKTVLRTDDWLEEHLGFAGKEM